jgi:hypothetical protein
MILLGHVYFALISQGILFQVIVTTNERMFQSKLLRSEARRASWLCHPCSLSCSWPYFD